MTIYGLENNAIFDRKARDEIIQLVSFNSII